MIKWNKLWIFISALTIAFAFSIIIPEELLARRGGGSRGGSRSRSSSSWKSKKTTKSKKSDWQKKSKATSGTRSSSKNSKFKTKNDKKLYNNAKKNGTVYKSRAEAKQAFQQKYNKQYGSNYSSKPGTRPDHIPNNTTVSGKTYPVSYNQGRGGYGYMGPSGSWVAYSVFRDVAMMSMLMNHHNYYGGAVPRGGGCGVGITPFIILGLIGFFLYKFLRRRQ